MDKTMSKLDAALLIIATWLLGFLTGYFKGKNK